MKTCDLHTHSTFSDGSYTPAELIAAAIDRKLSAVALCDHNTVDGLPQFLAAAEGKDIEAIPGAEFSVDYGGKELHLLGLFISSEYYSEISQMMVEVAARKEKSNRDLIRALNQAGYQIDFDTIRNATQTGHFNRVQIAAELTRKGYVKDMDQAFEALLDPAAGFYKEPKRLSFWSMLDFLKKIGAIPVLAHPLLNLSATELETLLPLAKEQGLAGMECYYSTYNEEETQISLRLAQKFNLKCSGGSDFHGLNKPGIELGVGKGNLKIPYDWAIALKTAE